MELHKIPKTKGNKNKKRLGKGHGSGFGKTSGKGHKGFKARSGKGKSPLFEGGQTPISKKLPRRGFNNKKFQTKYTIVGLTDLNDLKLNTINKEILFEKKIIKSKNIKIKILGNLKLSQKMDVTADAFSKTAEASILSAGGSINYINERKSHQKSVNK